jgi:N-acetylglucosamine kinase-like BadF-type ATPase
MADSQLVVGVDGGNTKTVALVCDLAGEPLGIGRGGSSNWESMGVERAMAVVGEVIDKALAMAGRKRSDVAWVHMGLAGLDWPDDEPRMREALIKAGWKCGLSLENDAFLALRASTQDGYGIGVTAGTGVAAGIIRPNGEKFFFGAFTDLGGGWSIDSDTLHAVIRQEDGRGGPTALAPALLASTGKATITDLVYALHRGRWSPERGVVRRVLFQAAAQGDEAAVAIVKSFGTELALCATTLIKRYGLVNEEVDVVASGSLFMKTGPLLYGVFQEQLLESCPRTKPVLADRPPLMGAVRGALEGARGFREEVWRRIIEKVPQTGWLRELSTSGAEEENNG